MITSTQIRNAQAAVTYFGRELGTSDYYLAQKGVWYGKGARILGLAPEVNKEDFVEHPPFEYGRPGYPAFL